MKVLFVIACVLVAVSAFNFKRQPFPCDPVPPFMQSCASVGENCTASAVSDGNGGFISITCEYGTTCVRADPLDSFGLCATVLGGDCNEPDIMAACNLGIPDQSTRTECDPTTDLCSILTASFFANDECSADNMCIGNMNCTNNLCEGFGANATCTEHGECAYGWWCDPVPGECRPQAQLDGDCVANAACAGRLLCNTAATPSVCVDYNMGVADDPCVGNQFCNADNYCSFASSPAVCLANNPGGIDDCDVTADCTAPMACACDTTTDTKKCFGQSNSIVCPTERAAYRACLNTHQCFDGVTNGERIGSCARENCFQEYACQTLCMETGSLCTRPNQAELDAACNPAPTDGNTGGTDGNTGSGSGDGGDGGSGSGTSTSGGTSGGTSSAALNSNWLM